MSESICPKSYAWCDLHTSESDLPEDHRKKLGYGIELYHFEGENETYINWMPDFTEWIIRPGEVGQELSDLAGLLASLPSIFNRFVSEVTGVAPKPTFAYETRPCTDPNCREQSHEWSNGECIEACSVEPIDSPDGWYRVHAGKSPDDSEWVVWVDADRLPDGTQAGAAVASLAVHIEEMQQRVEQLNEGVVRTVSAER